MQVQVSRTGWRGIEISRAAVREIEVVVLWTRVLPVVKPMQGALYHREKVEYEYAYPFASLRNRAHKTKHGT